jgi:hypothetical protein
MKRVLLAVVAAFVVLVAGSAVAARSAARCEAWSWGASIGCCWWPRLVGKFELWRGGRGRATASCSATAVSSSPSGGLGGP